MYCRNRVSYSLELWRFDLNNSSTCFFRKHYFCPAMEIITAEQTEIARFARVLAHPVRVYILELLSKQSCCYSGDLSEELPIAKSTLSQHLKELKEAGLIQGEIELPRIKYCINQENWKKMHQLFHHFFTR